VVHGAALPGVVFEEQSTSDRVVMRPVAHEVQHVEAARTESPLELLCCGTRYVRDLDTSRVAEGSPCLTYGGHLLLRGKWSEVGGLRYGEEHAKGSRAGGWELRGDCGEDIPDQVDVQGRIVGWVVEPGCSSQEAFHAFLDCDDETPTLAGYTSPPAERASDAGVTIRAEHESGLGRNVGGKYRHVKWLVELPGAIHTGHGAV